MTKHDAIQSKLLGIDAWLHKAVLLPEGEVIELNRIMMIVERFSREVCVLTQTSEEDGKRWKWWD